MKKIIIQNIKTKKQLLNSKWPIKHRGNKLRFWYSSVPRRGDKATLKKKSMKKIIQNDNKKIVGQQQMFNLTSWK